LSYTSDAPVYEYVVESEDSSKDGVYWLFDYKDDVFLAFNPTNVMGNGILDRMTGFCEYNSVAP